MSLVSLAGVQKRKWCAVAVFPALALIAAGCRGAPDVAAGSERGRPTPVAVAAVTRQDLTRELELAAEFRPYQEIDLHAKVSGYLKSVHVDVGDRVRQGQLLAVLEVPEMAQDLAHASSNAKRATLEVERAKGDLRRAESALNIRKLSYERLQGVLKQRPNLIAQQEIDDAEARFTDAQAQLMAAQAGLAASEEQVTAAQANKERIETMLTYLRITAPFAGVITQRRGDPGALVQAGTASHTQAMPVVRLSQIDRLRLVLPVPESIVPRVRLGAPVEIRVDTLNRIFQGRIARFSGRLETATRTMETEVDIPNPGRTLMPGMYGYASLRLDRRDDTLAVPVQAISRQGERATAMVVNSGNTLEERPVEIGLETPELLEVVSGLAENDRVVLGNRSRLKAGMAVEAKLVERTANAREH
jgi:RND family efflux transporter MFP subunit